MLETLAVEKLFHPRSRPIFRAIVPAILCSLFGVKSVTLSDGLEVGALGHFDDFPAFSSSLCFSIRRNSGG
jgi:hypothetical protein